MCGIAGILDIGGKRDINTMLLTDMRDSLIHRGPDEAGIYSEAGVGLAHRRLAVIDLASGQQPLSNESGSVTITYNGEIYNYKELTRELEQLGHRFKTNSDTEVIVHAWEQWGEACVDRFRGMFVFCIWDNRTRSLFLARDRLGIKPLYYSVTNDGYFVFASELKALTLHPSIELDLHLPSVENYFALGYVPEPDSIFSGISKLEAGHTLAIKNGRMQAPKQYWDVSYQVDQTISYEDAQHELIERLKEAIEIRLVSEVPVGAFLSGGVDSSAVVALMSEMRNKPVHTCSIGMNDPAFDESKYALEVSELFNTNHHHRAVGDSDYTLMDKLVNCYDEPFADSSALPTYRVCELATQRVTVALSGDGSDEQLSGYRRHRWHMKEERVRQSIPGPVRSAVFGPLGKLYPKADWAPQFMRAKSTFQALARDSVAAYFHTVSMIGDSQREQLFSRSFSKKLAGHRAIELFRRHQQNAPTDNPMALIQYLDLKTYLVDDILTKVDRASMAHSLEVRVPFLDHKLVEWMATVQPDFKIRNNEGKAILKKSLDTRLPNDIIYRNKMGFSIPLANWMRGALAKDVQSSLLGDRMMSTGIFCPDRLKTIVQDHQSGRADHSTQIWSLMIFDKFLKRYDCSVG